jgi:precorrin-2/cobalt-factor-2 C20-methyltransferase
MSGTLYGVGVGPGDPELMTLKACRVISQAKVIFYLAAGRNESLARSIAASFMPDDAEEIAISLPMSTDPKIAARVYDDCASRIAGILKTGQNVVMLCEGDPLFYGSFAYVMERIENRHNVQVIPGVNSISATASVLTKALTRRSDVLKVVPATLPDARLEAELNDFDTLAIIKTGRHLPRVAALLKRKGHLENAIAVERATQSVQRIFKLADADHSAVSYFTTVIVYRKEQV